MQQRRDILRKLAEILEARFHEGQVQYEQVLAVEADALRAEIELVRERAAAD